MLQLIYGRAGSGKTTLLFDKIKNAIDQKKKIMLLVPEQQVFECEKTLCERKLYSFDAEVVGFRRLCNMIFRKWGGLSYRYIGNGAKLIVMWKALRELDGQLEEYVGLSLDDLSVLELLERTVEEFERYGIDADLLTKAADELSPEDTKLSRKLRDLSMIMTLDLALLHQNYDNPEEDLPRAAKMLSEHDFFKDTIVFIDGFTRFAPTELDIIKHIFAQSESVYLTLPCIEHDRAEMMLAARNCERSIKKCASSVSCRFSAPIVCDNVYSTDKEDLVFLHKNLWNFDRDVYDKSPENIFLTEASDIYAEAESVACKVAELVQDGHYRYREIALILRDPNSYIGILDSALEKYGIPCFMSSRTGLCMKPCVRLIGSALMTSARGWKREDVVSYMRCGLSGLSPDECDIIEEYAKTWNISGALWYMTDPWTMNPNGFSAELSERDADLLDTLNKLRVRLVDPLYKFCQIFDTDPTVRAVATELYNYLCGMDIPKILAEEEAASRSSGDLALAEETVQVWDAIVSALESLVTVVGDMSVNADRFYKLLFAIFQKTDIGKIPARADEVIIGEPKLLHKPGIKQAFILGLNEGIFPATSNESRIIDDSDKDKLRELGIELADDSESAAAGELYAFYRAACLPSDALRLSYHADINPSVAVYAVRSLYPKLEVEKWIDVPSPDKIRNTATAIEYAAANMSNDKGRSVFSLVSSADSGALAARVNEMIDAFSRPISEEDCMLESSTADRIVDRGLNLTQARVENFVKCPFSFFAKNVLSLKEQSSEDFEAREVGDYMHAILETFFVSLGNRNIRSLSPDELVEYTNRAVEKCRRKIISQDISPRLAHLFDRLRTLAILLVNNIAEEFADSDFEPKLFELAIDNRPGNISPLKIKFANDKILTIYGRVDRVDVCKNGDDVYLRVVDYKTGKKKFSIADLRQGLDFQMPIYLLSLCKTSNSQFLEKIGADKNGNVLPAGLLYFSARMPDATELSELTSESDDRIDIERSGLLVDNVPLIESMERSKNGRFLPISYDKNGVLKKSGSVISAGDFEILLDDITKKISSIGDEIADGVACAKPMKDHANDPCAYCGARCLCRISDDVD